MRSSDWWRGAVLYQIYPRSFYDSNGDGIGDLRGITEKLDYVADLGVKGIWVSPFFPSPMKDFGYDVSDYRDVDPIFGSLKDFDALLEKAHKLGLKVIIDLVLSHTSDRHKWFQDSRLMGEHKDWYVWADAKADGSPPNNWVSVFGGPAWEFDAARGQYFLHHFLKEQPDLNFHHKPVQEEALDTARFWLDRGVDGFRLDVVNFYFHDRLLRDNPPRTSGVEFATQFEGDDPYSAQQHVFDKSQPEMYDFLRRFRKLLDQYDGIMSIGEIGDDHPYKLAAAYTDGTELLHTTYNTHMMSGQFKELTKHSIIEPLTNLREEGGTGWPSWAFSNHDVVRSVSRWHHEDSSGYGHCPERAQLLIALLCCLHGTVFLYQGEELGLPESEIPYEQLQDPWGIHLWPEWQGRDGCRTPMPWGEGDNLGFSKVDTWLPMAKDHHSLTIAAQEKDEHSTLNFTKKLLRWRDQNPALEKGEIEFLDTNDDAFLAFTRKDENSTLLCLFNLGPAPLDISDYTQKQGREISFGHTPENNQLPGNRFTILKIL